ncbi:MAG: aminotransferase class I/II-fold pyridoxal phosphate-dependent enzyme [Treponema sp.]|nr:aminotransferase class I/II-fold pyridoxal phosphate-dependent enzyme [Treponema sp.]
MKPYDELSSADRAKEKETLQDLMKSYASRGLALNMARGKPGEDQLDLSMGLLETVNASQGFLAEGNIDTRNYGELTGLGEAKKLFAQYLGVPADDIIVGGSSSLNMMYDCLARAMLTGVLGSPRPWVQEEKVKFLCPVPGYDRHFSICQFLGIEMINVPMDAEGPDMDLVEELSAADPLIKGMWCVPKYSNPTGLSYSDRVIRRLGALRPAAKDFRIFCDNAYAMHLVYRDQDLLNPLDACKEGGNPHMLYLFGSTNKITFPGAGVAFMGASKENIAFTAKQLSMQAIGWDKINMLRHVRFLKDMAGIRAQMEKHAAILRPKFDAVLNTLETQLRGLGAGEWIKPEGGYFITFVAPPGCAKRIVALCKEAGVVLTDAGATHPYGIDPEDRYVRIAPSFPPLEELKGAMEVFCTAAKLAALEKLAV